MGRRALRRIDPTLDLSRHYLEASADEPPLRINDLFSREAPLEVEVGSGKGLFLLNASAALPSHDFVGIEIARKYARHAAARLARVERPNAIMIQGDALRLFSAIDDASLHAVHVYFPDPWWKKRHRKRRVMNEPFLQDVQRVLRADGKLHFWTDVREYFESTVELIADVTQLAGPQPVEELEPEHDLDYRTHFERRMRLHDQDVFRSVYLSPHAGAMS